jgi:peptidoglycan hydrolase CwlO-like protein
MDHNLLLQIIAAIVYFSSVLYMDSRYTQCCNDINDELREARNINRDLEEQISKYEDQIEGHKFLVESAEKRETELDQEIIELMREKKQLLEQLLERGDIIRNLEAIITDRQAELESLNEKVSKIAKSATILVEEAETPHLVPV